MFWLMLILTIVGAVSLLCAVVLACRNPREMKGWIDSVASLLTIAFVCLVLVAVFAYQLP